jgi:anti-sigma factor RsiW
MTENNIKCDQNLVDLLYDQELDQELDEREVVRLKEHLETCPSCRQALKENQALSTVFKAGFANVVSRTSLENIENRVMDKIQSRSLPWWSRIPNLLTPRRMLFPATAVAALLVVLILYFPGSRSINGGPSALVSSLGGETSSVMIFETPNTRHTIIWFQEI